MFRRTLLILSAAALLSACSGSKNEQEAQAPADKVSVKTFTVSSVSADSVRVFTANVESDRTAVLTPKIPGYIEQINVVPGQHVKKGELLAVIKSDEIAQKALQADSGVMEAANGQQQAQTGYKMAQSQLAQAQAQYDLAEKTYNRYSALMKSNSVSKQEFDTVQSQYDLAKQSLNIAKDNVTLAGQKTAQGNIRYKQASAMRGEASAYLSYTQIRAPFDGVILEKNIDEGSFAAPGTPVFKVGDNVPVLTTYISQNMLTDVQKGSKVSVTIDALNKTFGSVVKEISPDVDLATGSFKVKLAGTEGLVSGMSAKAQFITGKDSIIAVPSSAVVLRGQLTIVFVDDNGRADMRVVKLGRDFNGAAEILSGLSAGEKVVVYNAEILKSGDILEAK